MSVVGFDFGTQNSRIAVVRAGGVDVICNEVSDRATPSMVSFDAKRRYAGDASRTQQIGNFRNTVTNLPRLVGRLADEPSILQVERGYETCELVEEDGVLAAQVSYRGDTAVFSNTELVAMFLNKLKAITTAETKTAVSDVIISVPSFFTEKERRALMDAAEIAGLNCLRTVNDTTAAAINYGMMKTEIPTDKAKNVIILDIGYAGLKACLASFLKGRVDVRANVYDMQLGGRDFDELLVNHFGEHFVKTRKVEIRENKKALLRLRVACERMRKILSGVQITKLDLECLIDGADFPLEASRQLLEEISKPLLKRIESHLLELVRVSGIPIEEIDSIEIIGGTTRTPMIKNLISQIFGKEVSTTLNADEAVSRGCALLCAIDSPSVKVRDYIVNDVVNYPMDFKWVLPQTGQVVEEVRGLFVRGENIGTSKMLQANVSILPIVLEAHYSPSENLPIGTPLQIGKFTISSPVPLSADGVSAVHVKLNQSGLIEVDGAFRLTNVALEGEDKKVLSTRIETKAETFRMGRPLLQQMKEDEVRMTVHDKLVAEIDDSRNSVEEFIFESRFKLDETYAAVASEDEKEVALKKLSLAEEWLYDEGADLGKEEYIKKFEELRSVMKPFVARIVEQERVKAAIEAAAAEAAALAAQQQESLSNEESDSSPKSEVPTMDMD